MNRSLPARRGPNRIVTSCRALVSTCALGALAACGGGGGDDAGNDATVATRMAALTGIYTDPDAAAVGDVAYIEIDAEGRMTVWDYLGDAADVGPDCHWRLGPVELVALGDDAYVGRYEDVTGEDPVTMYRDGDELVGRFIDEDDEDGDGDVTETLEDRVQVAAGISSSDFVACTDEQVELWIRERTTGLPEGTFADPARTERVFGIDFGAPARDG